MRVRFLLGAPRSHPHPLGYEQSSAQSACGTSRGWGCSLSSSDYFKNKGRSEWTGLVFLYGLVLVCFLEDEIKFLAACHVHFVVYG